MPTEPWNLPGMPTGLTIGRCWISAKMPCSAGMSLAARSLDRLPQIAIGPEAVARHRRGVPDMNPSSGRSGNRVGRSPETGGACSHAIERNKTGFCGRMPGKAEAYSPIVPLSRWPGSNRGSCGGGAWRRGRCRRRPRKRRRSSMPANVRLTACPFAHCLHRLGLLSKAQLITTRLAAWATLEEAQRLEVERRFAERVKQYREQQRQLAGIAAWAAQARASGPKTP